MAPPLSTFGHRDEGLNGAMHASLDMQLTEISTKFKGKPQGLSHVFFPMFFPRLRAKHGLSETTHAKGHRQTREIAEHELDPGLRWDDGASLVFRRKPATTCNAIR
jgi:hypothetical protein